VAFDRRASPVHDFLYQRGCWFGSKFGMALYRRWVSECTDADPQFPAALRAVALDALACGDASLIDKAMQALAEVGTNEDIEVVGQFADHADSRIANNVTTCIFEIRQRMRHRNS
jgi:hypothetical protein